MAAKSKASKPSTDDSAPASLPKTRPGKATASSATAKKTSAPAKRATAAKSAAAAMPPVDGRPKSAKKPGTKAVPAAASRKPKVAAEVGANQARFERIKEALAIDWPDADSELDSNNPFEMLCATILAAQCTDKRVNEIAPLLFAEFPDAPALASADPERVKAIIHPTGFFNNKTKSLIGMAKALVEKHGGEVPRTLDELTALPGVGRKTAWCVLGRYFGVHGIIVDTHMTRVSERLGFHTESDAVKIEMIMNDLVPEPERTIVSHRITLHGRYVCQARKPQCSKCSIRQWCPSADLSERN